MKKQPAKKATKKATKPRKPSSDPSVFAHDLVQRSLEALDASAPMSPTDSEISRVMSELGRRGGKIGGKRRLVTLTQEERSQIAYKAAQARWAKRDKP